MTTHVEVSGAQGLMSLCLLEDLTCCLSSHSGHGRTLARLKQVSCVPDLPGGARVPEVWLHLLPPLLRLPTEGAQRGGFPVSLLLRCFSEEGPQARHASWEAGLQDQGVGAPAESRSAHEPKRAQVPRYGLPPPLRQESRKTQLAYSSPSHKGMGGNADLCFTYPEV